MRRIEREIIGAMQSGLNASLSVRDRVETSENTTKLRLWDSNIFSYHRDVNEVCFCFCGYQTNTTKSRINALLTGFGVLGSVYQKNYSLFLSVGSDVYEIGSRDRVHINRDTNAVSVVRAA